MNVIGPDHVEAMRVLLREYAQIQNRLLVEMLREYRKAQFSALEEALTAHLKAQNDTLDRILARLEGVFRAPSSEPERRLDS
jgi:hypothetical protein